MRITKMAIMRMALTGMAIMIDMGRTEMAKTDIRIKEWQ